MDEIDTPTPPIRWMRIVIGGVTLGLVGVAISRLVMPGPPPVPALADSSGYNFGDPAWQEELARRVRTRFPPGSSEAAMSAELLRQGFARREGRVAEWHGRGGCDVDITISWEAVNGRIVSTAAREDGVCR